MVGDFDSNGSVDFLNFFMFADAFGSDGRAKLFALAEELIGLPRAVSLAQNYPNPFNSATTIEYALRSVSGVLLEVYDLGGQRVRKLVDHYRDGGRYQVSWDALDKFYETNTRDIKCRSPGGGRDDALGLLCANI